MDCDYISRQAAIDALNDLSENYTDKGREWHPHIDFVIETIDELPPADVKPVKRGKWINKKIRWVSCVSLWWEDAYECSKCGEAGLKEWNFCPNCGADMRGESDEM